MIKKHSVLVGLIISLVLLGIAISIYPGGTYQDKNSIGFDWTENYISNLFEAKSLNGSPNTSRIWAYFGMFIYSIGCAVFFVNMSKKIPEKNFKNIIKYAGILIMPTTFLIITPLHDIMLNISSFLFWNCIAAITVFIFMTNLHFFKIYNTICLLIFFAAVYIHSSSNWDLLPIIQKVNILSSVLLILGLEYFTKKEDFAHIKNRKTTNL
ncbi:MAG: hypothetical protein IPN20_25450 [Haliscomenobacter sp.]|nr:hypothetical protein [Haliscomenobacter sp.]